MSTDLEPALPSVQARVAQPGEGIGLDELALATRNHGLPLEALRYDVTPPGLHYVLVHYDIPAIDPATWRLEIAGAVEQPLTLSLEDLRSRPVVGHRVTLECAGNGRARLTPRPVSQPWLVEAVGTASGPAPRWRRCCARPVLARTLWTSSSPARTMASSGG